MYWITFFSLPNFRCIFFNQDQVLYWSYLMVGPVDVNRKWRVSVRCWITYITLIFYITHDLDFGFVKVRFWNSRLPECVGLIHVKWKAIRSCWIFCWRYVANSVRYWWLSCSYHSGLFHWHQDNCNFPGANQIYIGTWGNRPSLSG